MADAGTREMAHVDGGTGRIDARVALPADFPPAVLAVQNATTGFVVARGRVAVFGQSTLTVESTVPPDGAEIPNPIEPTGGPYLGCRQAGTVVRLGPTPTSLPVGGPFRGERTHH